MHVIALDLTRGRISKVWTSRYRWRCSCGVCSEWMVGRAGKAQARAEWRQHEAETRREAAA